MLIGLLFLLTWCNAVRAEDQPPEIIGCPVTLSTDSPERIASIQSVISEETFTIKASASVNAVTSNSITVPVSAWIIQPNDETLLEGEQLPTPEMVQDQIAALNQAASNQIEIDDSIESNVRSATPFEYKLCRRVQYSKPNDLWYAASTRATGSVRVGHVTAAMKAALHVGNAQTLNMYVKPVWRCQEGYVSGPLDDCEDGYGRHRLANGGTSGRFAGISTFPWNLNEDTAKYDGIIIQASTLPGQIWNGVASTGHPGGSHEVGHWHGLLHTFEDSREDGIPPTGAGQCRPDDPTQNQFYGDGCADTPPMISTGNQNCANFVPCDVDDDNSIGCPNSCPLSRGRDPNYNHMNYLQSHCHREYTGDQAMRMFASWRAWRGNSGSELSGVRLPRAINDAYRVAPGQSWYLYVLENDVTDLVSFDLQIDRIITQPAMGTARVSNDASKIVYTLDEAFEGQVTLEYSIFDCNGVSSPAEVTINVQTSVCGASGSCLGIPGSLLCAATEQIVTLSAGSLNSCDDTPMPESAVNSTNGLGYRLYPSGPYPPGSYVVTAIPENSSPPCEVQLRVVPCPAQCQSRTVATDPGLCQAGSVSVVDRYTIGQTALSAPQTSTQSPAGPYPLGVTPSVTATVHYPAGVNSAPTGAGCTVMVQDLEPPRVRASHKCIYPASQQRRRKTAYLKVEHCFNVAELATFTDNCPNAAAKSLSFLNCRMVHPKMSKAVIRKMGAACSIPDSTRLCVSLVTHPGSKKRRVINATVRAIDASGNSVEVETEVVIYFRAPAKRRKAACEAI
jgi:hypothetical protein